MADIADDEEGRASVRGGEVGDVVAALVVGAFEGAVEGAGAAATVAGFCGGCGSSAVMPCLVSQTQWRAL